MPGFTNVARWGVLQVLNANNEDALRIAQQCFPGITPEHVQQIIDNPNSVVFDEAGNTIVSIGD